MNTITYHRDGSITLRAAEQYEEHFSGMTLAEMAQVLKANGYIVISPQIAETSRYVTVTCPLCEKPGFSPRP